MDQESKITYGVIALLIILLGGLAYILQPGDISEKVATASTTKKIQAATSQSATITKATTTMENKEFTGAIITTNKGVIEVAFGSSTPLTVANFGKLAGSNFYNGIKFHRVIKGFMIQAGDPLSKDQSKQSAWGNGGPGYTFKDELTGNEQYPQGALAMANAGPNTNGSQFFIVTANPGVPLPPRYTVFGKVTRGMETALTIENVPTTGTPTDRPLEDIVIEKVELK
jgi:cyclophilin family peptidyl-prolyl cis-trans isomerase